MSEYNFSNTDLLQIFDLMQQSIFTGSPNPLAVQSIIVPFKQEFTGVQNHVVLNSSLGGIYKGFTIKNTGNGHLTFKYKINSQEFWNYSLENNKEFSVNCIEGGTTFNSVFPFNGVLISFEGNGSSVLTLECEIEDSNDSFEIFGEVVTNIPFPS